jgi:hypothetical protein
MESRERPELFYRLMVQTVGLLATANLGQPYDFSDACPVCGAGALPIPPLYINATLMGKKQLDFTGHDGRLIVREDLAIVILRAELTGLRFFPVAHKTETRVRSEPRFVWIEPAFQWPPLAPASVIAREDQCPRCDRSGHFDSLEPGTELHYAAVPAGATDLGATYEYFGRWRARGASGPHVGGARLLIISSRLKALLIGQKVRHLHFEPLQVDEDLA